MTAVLQSTIVSVPREWLEKLPGEWWVQSWDEDGAPWAYERVDTAVRLADNPTRLAVHYHVHIPSGQGLPMELAPKDASILIYGGTWTSIVTWENERWVDGIGFEGEDGDIRAWLPLPGVAF